MGFDFKKVTKSGGGNIGAVAGGLVAGPMGAAAGQSGGSGHLQNNFSIGGLGGKPGKLGEWDVVGGALDDANPFLQGDKNAAKAKAEAEQKARELYGQTTLLNKKLDTADSAYAKDFNKDATKYLIGSKIITGEYLGKIGQLSNEATAQSKDAKATYTNTIQPEYKNAMSLAKTNAEQAMTLDEAGDPNNPIMKSIRELYDQQGKAAQKQGLQDYGVLSALGAQAAQGQFGAAGPMTSGQMGQIYAQNQGQAGDAYARAQQRMYDLQQQGLDKGFDQSNYLYEQGQLAQDRYGQSIGNMQAGENAFYDQQGKFRDELGGYAGDTLGVKAGLNADKFNIGNMQSEIKKGNAYAGTGREQNNLNSYYGTQQQAINNDLAATSANNASKGGFLSSILGAVMSDEREKKSISNISDSELDEFLSAVKPKTFEYASNKPGTKPGKRVGFMMQDVQGTELGDDMTRKGPRGELMYDEDNLNGILLAALARENRKSA
jgi:hypothetical protein